MDYETATSAVGQIVRLLPFEQVLAVFTVEDLTLAIESHVEELVLLACEVIGRSDPKGLLASSRLVDVLLETLFYETTSLAVVTKIETTLELLSSDDLIRRRILHDNNSLLMHIRSSSNAVLLTRYLSLLQCILVHLESSEYEDKLYIFHEHDIRQALEADVFLFISLTDFYTSLIKDLKQKSLLGRSGLSNMKRVLEVVIPTYGKIYAQRDELLIVKIYAQKRIFSLFREISMLEDLGYFDCLDIQFLHLSPDNSDFSEFLKFINPLYLMKIQRDYIFDTLVVSPSHLPTWRNFISNEESFDILKGKLNPKAILSLPYFEQMVLLEKMTNYLYSTHYLLNELPRVMSNLLDDEERSITEPETFELRRAVLENLLSCGDAILDVWSEPIKGAYRLIVNGGTAQTSATQVATAHL